MALQQLYYTSCERGLSGFAGFQFNAVTPGVTAEVMREVEQLTAYEPPPGLAYDAAPGRLADCPVNLCFAPGPNSIIANVVFVGTDFSDRYGNYFAHALTTTHLERDLGPLLPIELWRAPFWTDRTSDTVELPELPAPPPCGPLDRVEVGAFIRGVPEDVLPALLTAAWQAVTVEDRSVVVVTADADDAARWIAAVSYHLPAALVQRMSFATYHHRPSYSRLHLMGTTPDVALSLGAGALDAFYLFDLVGKQFTALHPHPLAALLLRIGLGDAQRVLDEAAGLTPGGGTSLDEWHPRVAAAAVLADRALEPPDLDALLAWLASSGSQLRTDTAITLGTELARQVEDDERRLYQIVQGSRRAQLPDLLDVVERQLVETQLERLRSGDDPAPLDFRIDSPHARAHSQRRCEQLLAAGDTDLQVGVLLWAADRDVRLSEDALVDAGKGLGTALATNRTDERLRQVLAAQPAVLRGALGYLEGIAGRDPDTVEAVVAGGLVSAEELTRYPQLAERYLLVQAARHPERKAELLGWLPATSAVPDGLLRQLWPTGWNAGVAHEVLERVSEAQAQSGALPEWFDRALDGLPGEDHGAQMGLWRAVVAHEVRWSLPPSRRDEVHWADRVLAALDQAGSQRDARLYRALKDISPLLPRLPSQLEGGVAEVLAPLLYRVPLASDAANLLLDVPLPVLEQYARHASAQLSRRSDIELVAYLVIVMFTLRRGRRKHAEALENLLLSPMISRWGGRDLKKLSTELGRIHAPAAKRFNDWLAEQQDAQPPPNPRLLRRLFGSSD